MPRACCLVVAVLAGLVAGPRAQALPLVPLGPGLWTVVVTADPGLTPWRFLVDTGTTHTLLSPSAARRAGLTVTTGPPMLTPAGSVDTGEATVPALHLGDRRLTGFRVLVVDLDAVGHHAPVDGVLGMDALAHDRVWLDLTGGQLTFPDIEEGQRIAGTGVAARRFAGRFVVDAQLDGAPRTLLLDSGAAQLVMFDADGAGAPVRLATAGGVVDGWSGRADLTLGDLRLGAVPTLRLPASAGRSGSDGLLPAALFGSVYIDRVRGEVRLVPRAGSAP